MYIKGIYFNSYLILYSLMSCKSHLKKDTIVLLISTECQCNKSFCNFYFHGQSP